MVCVAVVNALLNQVFIFDLGMGVAGSAWATGAAQLVGVGIGMSVFLSRGICREFSRNAAGARSCSEIRRALALGFPMGLLPAVDLIGLALFQAMQGAWARSAAPPPRS